MIDYMKRTDIFSDFRRGLSNSDIARDREVSRTTVTLTIGGKSEKFNMAVVSLCSNGRWAKLFKRQDKQALLEAHVNCFDFWGHVPSLMVYDNMRTAVKSFVGEKKPTAEICQLQAF